MFSSWEGHEVTELLAAIPIPFPSEWLNWRCKHLVHRGLGCAQWTGHAEELGYLCAHSHLPTPENDCYGTTDVCTHSFFHNTRCSRGLKESHFKATLWPWFHLPFPFQWLIRVSFYSISPLFYQTMQVVLPLTPCPLCSWQLSSLGISQDFTALLLTGNYIFLLKQLLFPWCQGCPNTPNSGQTNGIECKSPNVQGLMTRNFT